MLTIQCPACKSRLQVSAETTGIVACPHCHQRMTVPLPLHAAPAIATPQATAPPAPAGRQHVSPSELIGDFGSASVENDLPAGYRNVPDLGTPLFTCKNSITPLLLATGMAAVCLIISIAAGIAWSRLKFNPRDAFELDTFPYYMVAAVCIGTFGLFCLAVFEGIRGVLTFGDRLIVLTGGLLTVKRNKIDRCSWDEVDGLFCFQQDTKYFYLAFKVAETVTQSYQVRRRDGQLFAAGPGNTNVRPFGEVLQIVVPPILYPKIEAQFHSGQKVDCGFFQIDTLGIAFGQKQLPWEQIRKLEIVNGYVQLFAKSNSQPIANVPAAKVANLEVFYECAQRQIDRFQTVEHAGQENDNPFAFD